MLPETHRHSPKMKPLPLCYKDYLAGLPLAARRRLQVLPEGVVDLASNDSLGLSQHPAVIARAGAWLAQYGAGGRASRLVSGEHAGFARLEAKLAARKRTEAALILGGGFQANATLLPALLDRRVLQAEPLIFADRLIHASLYQGLAAASAGGKPLRVRRFHHNDLDHLEALLDATAATDAPRFIITESLFSMDGDGPDLARLLSLKEQYGAFLYLDEAHCTGMLGADGMGCATDYPGRVDLVMGTFSKGLGSYGAYVACSADLRDYLVNRCAGLIYSTALPPAALGAVDAALDLVPEMQREREQVLATAARLRQAVADLGLAACPGGASHIVPVIIGAAGAALAASAFLLERGIACPAIRPPTVPEGTSRLRISLNPAVDDAVIERLLTSMAAWMQLR
jgi:8-amino-7-oxononanoate synthase